jgi:hypothetical protein
MEGDFARADLVRVLAGALSELGHGDVAATLESREGVCARDTALTAAAEHARGGELAAAEAAVRNIGEGLCVGKVFFECSFF